jgi:hypothetical protein
LCPIDLEIMSLILLDFGEDVRHFAVSRTAERSFESGNFRVLVAIGRGEHVHLADTTIFDRMVPEQHGGSL